MREIKAICNPALSASSTRIRIFISSNCWTSSGVMFLLAPLENGCVGASILHREAAGTFSLEV